MYYIDYLLVLKISALDKFLKIKRAFPTAFKSAHESKIVSDVPILGQVIEDDKVRLLNITQPTSVKLLTSTVKTLVAFNCLYYV